MNNMEFCVYFSSSYSVHKQERLNVDIDDDLIDYNFVNNFHCFKMKKGKRIANSGVEKTNDEIVDTKKFLEENEGEQIIDLSFIFINTSNGYIYCHKCPQKRFKEILKKYFMTSEFTAGVDIDKLEKISNVELTFAGDPRFSQYNDILTNDALSINDALGMNDVAIERATLKLFMKEPSVFSKDKLRNLIKNYDNITIRGYDSNENMLKIAQEIQLIIKIELEYESIEDLINISFDEITSNIEKQYKEGGLSAYWKND